MLKISWTVLMSNEEVLRRAETKQTLLIIIRKKQLGFLWHTLRKNGLEELIPTGSVDGKRSRGGQREKYLTNLSKWMAQQLPRREKDKVKQINLLRTSKDRSMWKFKITHPLKGHGT